MKKKNYLRPEIQEIHLDMMQSMLAGSPSDPAWNPGEGEIDIEEGNPPIPTTPGYGDNDDQAKRHSNFWEEY